MLKVVVLQMHMIKKIQFKLILHTMQLQMKGLLQNLLCYEGTTYYPVLLLRETNHNTLQVLWLHEFLGQRNTDLIFCECDVVSSQILILFLQSCRNGKMLDVSVSLQCY